MSTSSSLPSFATSSTSPESRASAVNSLVEEWRRQHDLPVRGTSFHYSPHAPPRPPTTSSIPCPRVYSPPPPSLPPPCFRPATPPPLCDSVSGPAPEISISDWQAEEDSPALYVFLKSGGPPPVQQKGGDDEVNHDGHARHDSGVGVEKHEREGFWHGNGRKQSVLDFLLDGFAAEDAGRMRIEAEKKKRGLGIMALRKV